MFFVVNLFIGISTDCALIAFISYVSMYILSTCDTFPSSSFANNGLAIMTFLTDGALTLIFLTSVCLDLCLSACIESRFKRRMSTPVDWSIVTLVCSLSDKFVTMIYDVCSYALIHSVTKTNTTVIIFFIFKIQNL